MAQENGNILIGRLRSCFGASYDFHEHPLRAGGNGARAVLLWLDSLISSSDAAQQVIRPLTDPERFGGMDDAGRAIKSILSGGVFCTVSRLRRREEDIRSDILNGSCALVFRDLPLALTFELRGKDRRGVDEPKEEKVIKGARDGFTETLKSNAALVRRRISSPDLVLEEIPNHCRCGTKVVMVWQKGFTSPELTDELRRRLSRIDADAIISAAVIEQAVSDRPNSIFPQLITTERPDKYAMNILEGRVGILVDGLPIGWLAPGTFDQFFRVPEDESRHWIVSSMLTLLRYGAFILSLVLPAFYVAVSMYHQEMLPVKLMQAIITAKQTVPFPTAVETLTMLAAIELLQEAGLRLPNPVGETVSIIGALLVGQAAIDAKIVSPVVVIVVSLATIAGYTAPNQDMSAALRICRTLLVLTAVAAGMMGLAVGVTMLLYYLSTMECCGIPYTVPFSTASARAVARGLFCRPDDTAHRADPILNSKKNGRT